MLKVSFCTTCKGRLWQLRQTLPANIAMLDEESDIALLDYQSSDGLRDYIFNHFSEHLGNKLKYYQMMDDYAFCSSYAKNVAHRLAKGDILFSLDADNFIYDGLLDEVRALKQKHLLQPLIEWHTGKEFQGTFGRLAYHKSDFLSFNGYDENLIGLAGNDIELRCRLKKHGYTFVDASQYCPAIQNTREHKDLFVNTELKQNYNRGNPPSDYPHTWGRATVVDWLGRTIEL